MTQQSCIILNNDIVSLVNVVYSGAVRGLRWPDYDPHVFEDPTIPCGFGLTADPNRATSE